MLRVAGRERNEPGVPDQRPRDGSEISEYVHDKNFPSLRFLYDNFVPVTTQLSEMLTSADQTGPITAVAVRTTQCSKFSDRFVDLADFDVF